MRASGSTADFRDAWRNLILRSGVDAETHTFKLMMQASHSSRSELDRPAPLQPKSRVGPFCLLPTQFLLREGDKPRGSRTAGLWKS